MKFKKLKLNSFKSFVEPVDFEIKEGLTGVVGPNGCGKSNIVEAIKWVMGESSAKQMRGDDMDDVIFGGSSNRPQRDISEVTIVLDNTEMKSLTQFNEYDELEVKRRIERGKGSSWTINSNSVRAKDVNLLFADNSTGARTSGIVSQGQIANLINAKPETRRSLLEEAANITGLHHRRHEAELRLSAAENNLERLDDVIITMDEQKKSLSKQARQATRYRSVGDRLRKAEAILLLKKVTDKEKNLTELNELFSKTNHLYIELSKKLAVGEKQRLNASEHLPKLRKKEAEEIAILQTLRINFSSLENTLNQISDRHKKASVSLDNIKENINREKDLDAEAIRILEKLNKESDVLKVDLEEYERKNNLENENLYKIRKKSEEAENEQREIISLINNHKFQDENLNNEKTKLAQQVTKFNEEILVFNSIDNLSKIQELKNNLLKADNFIKVINKNLIQLEGKYKKSSEDFEKSKIFFEKSSSDYKDIDTELNALKRIVQLDETENISKLSQKIKVKEGFENSVSHVLGESLEAGLIESSKPYWIKIKNQNYVAYPDKSKPLIDFIDNPSFAKNSLMSVGIVDTEEKAKKLQSNLLPGQALTTEGGGLWRWDGFIIPPGSSSPTSEILKQTNRMRTLENEKVNSYKKLQNDEKNFNNCFENLKKIQSEINNENSNLDERKENKLKFEFELNELTSKESSKKEKSDLIQREVTNIETRINEIDKILHNNNEISSLNTKLESINTICSDLKAKLSNIITEQAKLEQNKIFCVNRISDIKKEKSDWEKRTKDSISQIKELQIKEDELKKEIKNLLQQPSKLKNDKNILLTKIDDQEIYCKKISDEVIDAESKSNEFNTFCRNIEIELRLANENKVKAESDKNVVENDLIIIHKKIENEFNCLPQKLPEKIGFKDDEILIDYEELETRQRRLIRERDEMGPVNLRAEIEMKELEDQISNILKESDDLQNAIEKLRTSIKTLNREGKERILVSFQKVQEQFQKIFKQLFGGGESRLEFTDPNDPLNSGLEIKAKPPGKQLQTLSLLSGGEKALTAISLLFAVFLSNPSPLCILDEVDAPLDDTNVARFCDLLDEIKSSTNTRFMIITHHRLTMARMDRLYGVTMSEKGVSQLVSVNLEKAVGLRETT